MVKIPMLKFLLLATFFLPKILKQPFQCLDRVHQQSQKPKFVKVLCKVQDKIQPFAANIVIKLLKKKKKSQGYFPFNCGLHTCDCGTSSTQTYLHFLHLYTHETKLSLSRMKIINSGKVSLIFLLAEEE